MLMVSLDPLYDVEEILQVHAMIERHVRYTGSALAHSVLNDWSAYVPRFVKVLPIDYKRVLMSMERVEAQGLSGEAAVMAAFEENKRDLHRVGGN
jgi:glutamate synthase (ferredoxin)